MVATRRKGTARRRNKEEAREVEVHPAFLRSSRPEWLNKLYDADQALSLPIFKLELGWAAEIVIIVFGTWFALPTVCWGPFTAAFGLADEIPRMQEQEHEERKRNSLVALALSFVLYSALFFYWLSKGKLYSIYVSLKQLATVPIMLYLTLGYGTINGGHNAGAYYAVTWVIAQFLCHSVKQVHHRVRPIVACADELKSIRRYVPDVQGMFREGHAMIESFPSSDTTGGAVFAAMTWKLQLLSLPAAILLSVVVALSRVYLQAHHLFDVSFALGLGWAVVILLWEPYGVERYFGPAHAVGAILFFVVFSIVSRKSRPPLPEHMKRKGKSMLGF